MAALLFELPAHPPLGLFFHFSRKRREVVWKWRAWVGLTSAHEGGCRVKQHCNCNCSLRMHTRPELCAGCPCFMVALSNVCMCAFPAYSIPLPPTMNEGGAPRKEVRSRAQLLVDAEGQARGRVRQGPDVGHKAEGSVPRIRHHRRLQHQGQDIRTKICLVAAQLKRDLPVQLKYVPAFISRHRCLVWVFWS